MSVSDQVKAATSMPVVEGTVHVTAAECKARLRQLDWNDETIAALFKGDPPKRVQIGNLMMVINGGRNHQ